MDSHFFRPKIVVPKLYLKLEFDTEDQVLFINVSYIVLNIQLWTSFDILGVNQETPLKNNKINITEDFSIYKIIMYLNNKNLVTLPSSDFFSF